MVRAAVFGFLRRFLFPVQPEDPAAEARRRLSRALDRAAVDVIAPALRELLLEPEFARIVGPHSTGLQVCWARKMFAPSERAVWHFGATGLFDVGLDSTARLSFQILPSLDAAHQLGNAVSWTGTGMPLFYAHMAVGRIEALSEFVGEMRAVLRAFAADLATAQPSAGEDGGLLSPSPEPQASPQPPAAARPSPSAEGPVQERMDFF